MKYCTSVSSSVSKLANTSYKDIMNPLSILMLNSCTKNFMYLKIYAHITNNLTHKKHKAITGYTPKKTSRIKQIKNI